MALVGWLWLASPFAVIAVISHDQRMLALIAARHTECLVLGWAGVVTMLLGVTLVPGPLGNVMFWVGTPLAGLAVWLRRDDGDGGGGGDPDVPPVDWDWDDFERSFRAHARRRGRPQRRPRTPSVR